MQNISIRPASAQLDAAAIAELYNHYIRGSIVTFEEQDVTGAQIQARINSVNDALLPWLVAEQAEKVVGFAYANIFRERSAYRFTVEATVYVDTDFSGNGIGSGLYRALLDQLQQSEVHSVIGIIALPNEPSVRLHEKFGFTQVAHLPEVGYKFDRWLDVGYWQLTLDLKTS